MDLTTFFGGMGAGVLLTVLVLWGIAALMDFADRRQWEEDERRKWNGRP